MSYYDVSDTIVAPATPPAGAARGVVRMSGPMALAIAPKIFRPDESQPSIASLKLPTAIGGCLKLGDPLGSVTADALIWPTSRSYTRQPTVEFHTIGCLPVLDAIVAGLIESGARMAEPGEFTLRAFLAGRLDLTQAEAVLGVIDAQDRGALDTALSQLAGGLAGPLNGIRGKLLDLLAHLEAGLDFVEDDIEFISAEALQRQIADVGADVQDLVDRMASRSTSDQLARVVIIGWPNVGKSSLLNALSGSSTALVSPTAGATRDYVSRQVELAGMAVEFVDTAGINREGVIDPLDLSAQDVTDNQAASATLRLFCLDATRELNAWEKDQLAIDDPARLIVANKIDQFDVAATPYDETIIPVSALTGEGLPELREHVADRIRQQDSETSVVAGTAVRCRESLSAAAAALEMAREASEQRLGEELVAAELRIALEEIGKVAGTVYTDDVLDRIFSRFCIGK